MTYTPHSRRMQALIYVCVLLVGMLGLSGCHKEDSPIGKTFRFPLSGEPKQLDPQVSTDAASITVVSALFETLTRLDDSGKAVPAAATWTVSEDGCIYTFTLKESKWSNGEPVTAADFLFGMQRTLSPETKSTLASDLYGIFHAEEVHKGTLPMEELGIRVLNEKTLEITLKEANPGFPEQVSGTPYMPCNEAFFEETAGRYGLEAKYVITNGPFVLSRWNHDQQLRLEKNEGYHNKDDVYPAAVTYVIEQSASSLPALTGGSLDTARLSADEADAAKAAGLRTISMQDTILYIWLNNQVKGLSVPEVRCALRDGLEWNVLLEQMDTRVHQQARGYIAPDAVLTGDEKYRREDNGRLYTTNGEQARSQLAAGLAKLQLDTMPKLTVLCADDAYSQQMALYIVQSWQKNLKLYFDIQALPAKELAARVQVGNYQIALAPYTVSGLTAMEAMETFTSSAEKGNLARFSQSAYDGLYARSEGGGDTRKELDELEAMLFEFCPSIPLAFEKRYYGMPETVSGLIIRPFDGGKYGATLDFRHAGKTEET